MGEFWEGAFCSDSELFPFSPLGRTLLFGQRSADPTLPFELGRLHRHVLAGLRGVRDGGGEDGSALKSGFLKC